MFYEIQYALMIAAVLLLAGGVIGYLIGRTQSDSTDSVVHLEVPGLQALIAELRCSVARLERITESKKEVAPYVEPDKTEDL